MKKSSAYQNYRSDDPIWYFLAEFTLSEFLSDHDRRDELTARLLFQAVRELGMSLECVENIETTLVGFAKEALVHFKQGRLEVPGRIRVFCQKKIIDDANLARATSKPYHTEQAMEHAQMVLDPVRNMNGGWGWFLIERVAGSSSSGSSVRSWNAVDLYLYKEGE